MVKKEDKIDKILKKVSIYIIGTFTIAYILSRIVFYVPDILKTTVEIISVITNIIKPFIYGGVIAYLIYPLVYKIRGIVFNENKNVKKKENEIEKIKKDENAVLKKRKPKSPKWKTGISVALTYVLIVAFLYLVVNLTYSAVAEKITSVKFSHIVDFTKETFEKYEDKINELTNTVTTLEVPESIKKEILKTVDMAKDVITDIGTGWMLSIKTITANVVNFFIGFIISFYLIIDLELFKNIWNKFLYLFIKKKSIIKVNSFIREMNVVLSSFIRGQLLDCFLVAIISIIALSVIRLEFSVALGIFAGITNIIPYFGPVIGMVPAVVVGLLSGNPWQALFAMIALIIVQQFDCNILSPKIVGESVGVHPVFVIIGILAGAQLFGILGMILAVPVCGIAKIILEKIIAYKESNEKTQIPRKQNLHMNHSNKIE